MKKRVRTLLWMVVAVVALAFLAVKTPRDTFQQAIRGIGWDWAIIAVLIYLVSQTLLATRWVLLLRVHGIRVSLFQAIKLTYLGLFYNNMMPGAVGGDLLKGWYITHHSEKHQRLEAAVTVFVDRLTGLVGIILVGALAGLVVGPEFTIQIRGRPIQIRFLVWLVFLGLVAVSVIFLSRRVRHVFMLDYLLERLPAAKVLKKIDSAIRIYRSHIPTMFLALVLTGLIQGCSIVAVWMLTQALHLDEVTFIQCLTVLPIVWLISAAVPVPGGLGVMENLFVPFFVMAIDPSGTAMEAARGQAAALALLNRLMICVCSLPGALVPIFGGHLPKAQEMEAELKEE
jgi:glycosyltransferase 2 family protein